MTVRVCLWSGPRNLSTAMMRSFGARADTHVSDEPFYAAYLAASGARHPMRDAVLAAHETDPEAVARACAGAAPDGAPLSYQKQMVHHLLDGFPRGWMAACRHAFLIRDPARVIASYAAKAEAPVTLADVGYAQQAALWDEVASLTGEVPVVVDADRLLANPEEQLRRLCGGLDVPFDPAMLSWAPGPRPTDGAWAPHWYASIEAASGFGPPPGPPPPLPAGLREVEAAARPLYGRLARYAA